MTSGIEVAEMDVFILVLCLSHSALLFGILIFGGIRVRREYKTLQAEREEDGVSASLIVVKQAAGKVRLAYLAEPVRTPIRAAEKIQTPQKPTQSDGIVIRKSEKLSFRERYERLSAEKRSALDRFTEYLSGHGEVETVIQENAMTYRFRKKRIVKAVIRKETPVLFFSIPNPELSRMLREEGLKGVNMKPAEIRLNGETELILARQTADLAFESIENEARYRAEKRNQARKAASEQKEVLE